ncbi:MAG TPA: hypothetical protein ENN69_01570, partial [Spirochaetia bacterium]|nr:hypothetical protein [Spirochaetia bacterium]
MRVLVTGPSLKDQGGVAGYYNALLPFLKHEGIAVSYLEIGGTHAAGGILSPLVDQLRFRSALRRFRPHLVHINPSFNLKSFLRGGFFIRGACRVRAGLPVLVFFRGWRQGFEHAAETRYRTFFTRTYGKAAAVIVLGRAIEQKLRAWGVTAPIHVEHTVVAEELLAGFSLSERLRG